MVTSAIQWYAVVRRLAAFSKFPVVCLLGTPTFRQRDRLCLFGRPWIEIDALSTTFWLHRALRQPDFFGDLRCTQFLCTSERQRCALILIFADSLPMLCSLRLSQTPGFRYHRRKRLGRVDVSVHCAKFGFQLYMLCVILRSSTWAPDCGVLFPRPLVFVVNWSCCSPVFAVLASRCHFARKGSTGQCVTLILWHTSLSQDSPA